MINKYKRPHFILIQRDFAIVHNEMNISLFSSMRVMNDKKIRAGALIN